MEKLNSVKSAAESKDADAFGQALSAVTERESLVPIFNKVLLEDWHDAHEDIVFELGLIGNPSSTKSIALAATIPFQYLEKWGNLHEFQRKCAYALARIRTEESRDALEKLSESSDMYLQEYGLEGLQKWPLKKPNKSLKHRAFGAGQLFSRSFVVLLRKSVPQNHNLKTVA